MQVIQKLMTLARGSARQSAQVLLDANALTVFEQEIIDVEKTIHDRKQVMSEIIVARKQIEREMASIRQLIVKRETQARRLLDEEREASLVEDIAVDIAQQETILESLAQQRDRLQARAESMSQALQKALLEVGRHRRELRVAKAQQVRASVLAKANHLPEQLSELEVTRSHVADLQSCEEDGDHAWSEMQDSLHQPNIESRLQAAGCSEQQDRARDVLARLKAGGEK
ncbi:PspA/IM30 family protein [Maricurvus nonylphenolicus]|uniref:PspA/IM30 family protein n=1 Tax=Maricurvus nonylphenolicus TaxID=1008307 RepID=UPI0036F421C9